jgi:hypothetical protein
LPSVPRYSGAQVDPTNAPSVRARAYDTGAQDLARGVQDLAGSLSRVAQQEIERQDTTALLAFENQLAGTENALFNDPEKGVYAKRGKDAMGVQEQVWPEWDKQTGAALNALPSRLRARATAMANGRRQDAQKGLMRHVMRESETYAATQEKGLQAAAVNAAQLNYLDPARIETEASRAMLAAQASADRLGVDETTRSMMLAESASSVYQAVIERHLVDDPTMAEREYLANRGRLTGAAQAAIEAKLAPTIHEAQGEQLAKQIIGGVGQPQAVEGRGQVHASFADAMKVLGPTEGGYVNDPVDRGGETKYGISKRAYPDLDIKNLTRAQAQAIYKRDYWDAIKADELPEAIRGLAFDAAVNQGPAKAREFIAQSGGDPAKFARLRHEHYTAIIKADPSQKRFEAGWRARVDRLTPAMGAAMGAADTAIESQSIAVAPPASEVEALRMAEGIANPLVRRQTEAAIRREFSLREMQKRETERAQDEQVNVALAQADPTQPLRSIIGPEAYARAEREGKLDALERMRMNRIQGTFVQDDPVLVETISREAVTNPDAFAKRNFDDPALQLRLSTSSLATFKRMAADANKPEKRADWASEADRIDGALRVLGIGKEGDTKGNASARDALRGEFRIAYGNAVKAFTQQNGKAPTHEQADVLARTVRNQFAVRQTAGKTDIYSSGERFEMQISEADRAAVRNAYRAKYGEFPTDAWVTRYVAGTRKATAQ